MSVKKIFHMLDLFYANKHLNQKLHHNTFKNRKAKLLENGWYTNLDGNLVHPHLMQILTPNELANLDENEFSQLCKS